MPALKTLDVSGVRHVHGVHSELGVILGGMHVGGTGVPRMAASSMRMLCRVGLLDDVLVEAEKSASDEVIKASGKDIWQSTATSKDMRFAPREAVSCANWKVELA